MTATIAPKFIDQNPDFIHRFHHRNGAISSATTDEQKRKGYSLIEQEDRLLKYCEQNKINVQGIFREDFSAKDFNRPEWKVDIPEKLTSVFRGKLTSRLAGEEGQ